MAKRAGGVRLELHDEPRLLAGVGGAVENFARRADMNDADRADLAQAAMQACRDTLPLLTAEHPTLDVHIDAFTDRIEIALEHSGEALPSAGLDTFLESGGEGEPMAGLELMARVDRVLYSTENGVSRTTLVKTVKRT